MLTTLQIAEDKRNEGGRKGGGKKKLKTNTKEVETENTEKAKWRQDRKQDKGTKEESKKKQHNGKVTNIISMCNITQRTFKVSNFQIKD